MNFSSADISHIIYKEQAHSKVNLRLKIEGRRNDGYHLLSMLNVASDLSDSISVEFISEKIELTSSGLVIDCPNSDENLLVKALLHFKQHFKIETGARIIINKQIPVGAGLGGGSSDAAAILRICARAWYKNICSQHAYSAEQFLHELYNCALKIGSDVPFCLRSGLAATFGIGEEITYLDCPDLDKWPIYILKPKISINTADFYKFLRTTLTLDQLQPDTTFRNLLIDRAATIDSSDVLNLINNDFQVQLNHYCPQLQQIISSFNQINDAIVSLSGSGSAFFVIPRHKKSSQQVLADTKSLAKTNTVGLYESSIRVFPLTVDFFNSQK